MNEWSEAKKWWLDLFKSIIAGIVAIALGMIGTWHFYIAERSDKLADDQNERLMRTIDDQADQVRDRLKTQLERSRKLADIQSRLAGELTNSIKSAQILTPMDHIEECKRILTASAAFLKAATSPFAFGPTTDKERLELHNLVHQYSGVALDMHAAGFQLSTLIPKYEAAIDHALDPLLCAKTSHALDERGCGFDHTAYKPIDLGNRTFSRNTGVVRQIADYVEMSMPSKSDFNMSETERSTAGKQLHKDLKDALLESVKRLNNLSDKIAKQAAQPVQSKAMDSGG